MTMSGEESKELFAVLDELMPVVHRDEMEGERWAVRRKHSTVTAGGGMEYLKCEYVVFHNGVKVAAYGTQLEAQVFIQQAKAARSPGPMGVEARVPDGSKYTYGALSAPLDSPPGAAQWESKENVILRKADRMELTRDGKTWCSQEWGRGFYLAHHAEEIGSVYGSTIMGIRRLEGWIRTGVIPLAQADDYECRLFAGDAKVSHFWCMVNSHPGYHPGFMSVKSNGAFTLVEPEEKVEPAKIKFYDVRPWNAVATANAGIFNPADKGADPDLSLPSDADPEPDRCPTCDPYRGKARCEKKKGHSGPHSFPKE